MNAELHDTRGTLHGGHLVNVVDLMSVTGMPKVLWLNRL
jgi:hypothetical protein